MHRPNDVVRRFRAGELSRIWGLRNRQSTHVVCSPTLCLATHFFPHTQHTLQLHDKIKQLIFLREIFADYRKDHTKHVQTACGQSSVILNAVSGGQTLWTGFKYLTWIKSVAGTGVLGNDDKSKFCLSVPRDCTLTSRSLPLWELKLFHLTDLPPSRVQFMLVKQ